jgi:hypothetical protein
MRRVGIIMQTGHEAENGSLYLITGCDKAKSWGVASFSNAAGSFGLTFVTTAIGGSTDHPFSWQEVGVAATGCGPIPVELFDGAQDPPQNQCTFLRGFKISLSETLWASLWPQTVTVSPIEEVKPSDISSKSRFIPFGGGRSWFSGLFSRHGGDQSTSGNQLTKDVRTANPSGDLIIASNFPPTSYVSATHAPSTLNPTSSAALPPVKQNQPISSRTSP